MNQTKNQNKNQNKNQTKNQTMYQTNLSSFHNDVKFTGSAFESTDNAMTMLMYFAVWVMLAMNALPWPN
jgi:hypothetical protein